MIGLVTFQASDVRFLLLLPLPLLSFATALRPQPQPESEPVLLLPALQSQCTLDITSSDTSAVMVNSLPHFPNTFLFTASGCKRLWGHLVLFVLELGMGMGGLIQFSLVHYEIADLCPCPSNSLPTTRWEGAGLHAS